MGKKTQSLRNRNNRKEQPNMPDFFNPNDQQPGQPRISDSGIGYYKSLLEDPAWCEENPAQASFLKTNVEGALAATGQSLEPPRDDRSPAQKLFDHMQAIEPNQDIDYHNNP